MRTINDKNKYMETYIIGTLYAKKIAILYNSTCLLTIKMSIISNNITMIKYLSIL